MYLSILVKWIKELGGKGMGSKRIFLVMMAIHIVLLSACSIQNENSESVNQSWFVKIFENFIQLLAQVFNGSYGLAIIAITIITRSALLPLTLKQLKSQQIMKEKMDLLKPELDELQKKLKETKDPQKQQQLQMEMLNLYKKHNVNPLSFGCLPILIQMPILMGIYYGIRGSKEIASHSFLWFNLGEPDLILTVIAGIVYYVQYLVSMSNIPKEQEKQMKWMGLLSPLMIVFISLSAPAALPLYWVVGGSFLIIQTIIRQKMVQTQNHSTVTDSNEK